MNLDLIDLNFDYEIFYSGRQAFKYILDEIHLKNDIEKIWMPEYYCQNAMNDWIKHNYNNIYFYKTKPFKFDKAIDISAFASKKDVVLLNNYWGLCSTIDKTKNAPIIIEDHSHGWLSDRCLNSQAGYCFASLRKSLPIPLGGICWKPKTKLTVDTENFIEDNSFYNAWNIAYKAMCEKKLYKEYDKASNKQNYLAGVNTVELFLDQHHKIIKVKESDKAYIKKYLNYNVLEIKKNNLKFLYDSLININFIKIIRRKNYTAFGLILLFKDEKQCNSLKTHLIQNEIYPSFLWPNNELSSKWKFSINIHVDFRYTIDDMIYIKNNINNWITANKTK
ncbi:hypothetical protein [Algibacter sp. R77976]|uniref:hypothetical protein n=1 Tax=Algibacter sp. R77976 TaxID=3093873 RepID=UPI0037C8497A